MDTNHRMKQTLLLENTDKSAEHEVSVDLTSNLIGLLSFECTECIEAGRMGTRSVN